MNQDNRLFAKVTSWHVITTWSHTKISVSSLTMPVCYLCVFTEDFPAGNVGVTVYSGGAPLNDAQLQYYNNIEEIACLLSRVTDPVDFMCQVKP